MKVLLVVAHGSRREESNNEVRQLTEQIRTLNSLDYDHVACAFLELAEPSIPGGIRCGVDAGADEIIVVPYFLSAGRHVREDIPAMIEAARQKYPQVSIQLAPHLGTASQLPALLLGLAEK